jgi:hypothetical protein
LPDAEDGNGTDAEIEESGPPPVRSIWGVSYIKRKLQERRAKYKDEPATDKAARRTATATVWIAVFTVILAGVGAFTLYEVIEGGNDTHTLAEAAKAQAEAAQSQTQRMETMGETARAQAIAAIELAEAAKSQAQSASDQVAKLSVGNRETHALAKTAQDSLILAGENFSKDQSPIIWVTPQPPHLVANERASWDVTFTNYGRSPALHTRQCVTLSMGLDADRLTRPPSIDTCANIGGLRSSSVVPPGGLPSFLTAKTDLPITDEQLRFVEGIDGGVVVIGIFEYEDRSARRYRTTFCNERLASGAMANCSQYNTIEELRQ